MEGWLPSLIGLYSAFEPGTYRLLAIGEGQRYPNANQLMTKVLVDGGIDFIGSHLIEALTGEGYPDLFDLA